MKRAIKEANVTPFWVHAANVAAIVMIAIAFGLISAAYYGDGQTVEAYQRYALPIAVVCLAGAVAYCICNRWNTGMVITDMAAFAMVSPVLVRWMIGTGLWPELSRTVQDRMVAGAISLLVLAGLCAMPHWDEAVARISSRFGMSSPDCWPEERFQHPATNLPMRRMDEFGVPLDPSVADTQPLDGTHVDGARHD